MGQEKHDINWIGVEPCHILADTAPQASRCRPGFWMLRLDLLTVQTAHRFRRSRDRLLRDLRGFVPPSWEPQARVRVLDDAVSPLSRPLSHVSEISTSFVESQLHEVEFVQVASLDLSGH